MQNQPVQPVIVDRALAASRLRFRRQLEEFEGADLSVPSPLAAMAIGQASEQLDHILRLAHFRGKITDVAKTVSRL